MSYRFMRFPGGKQKAVTFSYDDGVREDIRLADIFNQYDIKATFNINSRRIGGEHLKKEEIQKYILDCGHEVAIHGASHLAPGNIRPIDGIREFLYCREELEKMFDLIIRGMAYPDSGVGTLQPENEYANIRNYLKNLDIVYARTAFDNNTSFMLPEDWFKWIPTAHHNNDKIFEYIDDFNNISNDEKTYCSSRCPRLFYVWGHSFEFDRNGNWDRIEKICSKLGNREDVWYATNIDIYEYTTAYNSLIFSADGTRVYNPTDKKIWFEDIGDKIYFIEPGKTKKIDK